MTKILIIGAVWELGPLGGYETQLGNVAILVPMIKMLKKYIPDAEISTTIQFTDQFCMVNDIARVPKSRDFLPRGHGYIKLIISFVNIFRAGIWWFFKKFLHLDFSILIKGGKLERFANSDVILDFNGDVFPSDIHKSREVLSHAMDILIIRKLGVPVVEFVSSPGPFKAWFRRLISKFIFNRISVFANREPISSELLKEIGVKKTPIVNTACPAFLLEPASAKRAREILLQENIDTEVRPLIGITLSGYSLAQRTWGKRESFDGLSLYVPMLRFLMDELQANVFLLPHVYRINPYTVAHEHINGPDHDILLSLYREVEGDKYNGRLTLVEGKYTSSEAKSVIGQCDMYISGRLHAGVAALSQAIPTVLMAYGHKHHGFAKLLHQDKYVFEGTDPEKLTSMVEDAWLNRKEIEKTLKDRMVKVKELADLNFEIVSEIADLGKNNKYRVPKEKAEIWISKGRQV